MRSKTVQKPGIPSYTKRSHNALWQAGTQRALQSLSNEWKCNHG